MEWEMILWLAKFLLNPKEALENMEFAIDVIAAVLDKINDDQRVRDFTRGLGGMVASFIPGQKIEQELVVFLNLLKEGVVGENTDQK